MNDTTLPTDETDQTTQEDTADLQSQSTDAPAESDEQVDHAKRLMDELSPLDKVIAVNPDHVKDFINMTPVTPIGESDNYFDKWRTYRSPGAFMVTDSHPAVSQLASTRAATLLIAGQIYLNYIVNRTCLTEEDFQRVFGGLPPTDDSVSTVEDIALVNEVSSLALMQCWARAEQFTDEVQHYLDKITRESAEKLLIPAEKDGHAFRSVEFLYTARGGQFNVIAGMFIHYGPKRYRPDDAEALAPPPDCILLTPPDPSLAERFQGLEHDPEMELQIRAKEALLFVRDIIDFRNSKIDEFIMQVMEEMFQRLVSAVGEERLAKPETAPIGETTNTSEEAPIAEASEVEAELPTNAANDDVFDPPPQPQAS